MFIQFDNYTLNTQYVASVHKNSQPNINGEIKHLLIIHLSSGSQLSLQGSENEVDDLLNYVSGLLVKSNLITNQPFSTQQ